MVVINGYSYVYNLWCDDVYVYVYNIIPFY